MAARVILMAQAGQYNLGRCLKRGERGAAALCLTEFVQNALSLLFLLNRRYMPYYTWSFRAARELSGEMEQASLLTDQLSSLLTEGLCSETSEKRAQETVEEICREFLDGLRAQGLTDGPWDYLEPHAYEIMERIQDGELRNLHVMEG